MMTTPKSPVLVACEKVTYIVIKAIITDSNLAFLMNSSYSHIAEPNTRIAVSAFTSVNNLFVLTYCNPTPNVFVRKVVIANIETLFLLYK